LKYKNKLNSASRILVDQQRWKDFNVLFKEYFFLFDKTKKQFFKKKIMKSLILILFLVLTATAMSVPVQQLESMVPNLSGKISYFFYFIFTYK